MNRRIEPMILLVVILIFIGALPPLLRKTFTPSDGDLPRLGLAPELKLITHNGTTLDDKELAGKVLVVNFFFTRCPAVCPAVHASLRGLYSRIPQDKPVQFVSITVDPEHDTPERLRDYAASLAVEGDRWRFLTGDQEQIRELLEGGFRLGDAGEAALHTTRLVLVDRTGKIRGYYHGTDNRDLERLFRDIKKLS